MKTQYHFEILFTRLAVKTDLFPAFTLRLAIDPNKQTPSLTQKYMHRLTLERQQRVINIKHLEPFRFIIPDNDRDNEPYSLQLNDQATQQTFEQIPLLTYQMIKRFEAIGKGVHDQRHEGTYMNFNFKVSIEKVDPQKQESRLLASSPSNKEEKDIKLSHSLSRTKRPPQLNIHKKSELRESQRLREVALNIIEKEQTEESKPLFKGMAEESTDKAQIVFNIVEEKEKDSNNNSKWQPMSALPDIFSAWWPKKKLNPNENEIQQVKELLESHHPTTEEHHTVTTLSLKLKIVIAMLVLGLLILIADMLKKQTYKLFYGEYPKPAPATRKQKGQQNSKRLKLKKTMQKKEEKRKQEEKEEKRKAKQENRKEEGRKAKQENRKEKRRLKTQSR